MSDTQQDAQNLAKLHHWTTRCQEFLRQQGAQSVAITFEYDERYIGAHAMISWADGRTYKHHGRTEQRYQPAALWDAIDPNSEIDMDSEWQDFAMGVIREVGTPLTPGDRLEVSL